MWAALLNFVFVFLQAASGLAQTPSPALLVLDKNANEMAIVDPTLMTVVGRVPVGDAPHEVATDGKFAFVSNYGARTPGNTISVIDLATQKEVKRVDLGTFQRPHGIVVSGGMVYFTVESTTMRWTRDSSARPPDLLPPGGTVSTYDPTGRKKWTWSTGQYGTHMLAVSRDGKQIFTTNIGSNTVSIYEIEGPPGRQETVIRVGKAPEGIDISPDGREVWVANSRDGSISIIDVAGKHVIQTLSISTKRSNRLKFTPDGNSVLVSDMEGDEVVVLDSGTRTQVKRIKTGAHPEGIQMAPDGSRAFVALGQEGAVIVIDLKSLKILDKLPTGPGADGMAWVN